MWHVFGNELRTTGRRKKIRGLLAFNKHSGFAHFSSDFSTAGTSWALLRMQPKLIWMTSEGRAWPSSGLQEAVSAESQGDPGDLL